MKNGENKVKTTAKAACPDDEMLIVITHLGYIERIPLAKLQSQVHDDVGVKAFHTRDDETPDDDVVNYATGMFGQWPALLCMDDSHELLVLRDGRLETQRWQPVPK